VSARPPSEESNASAGSAFVSSVCIICTAPRTGSSLLAEGMKASGCLGLPAEYFDIHARNQDYWIQRLGIPSPADYLERVIAAGSTPNGMFGLKLHWHQIPALLDAFARATLTDPARAGEKSLDEWLNSRFLSSHYLWLRRRNKVAQGISYYRATETNVWRAPRSVQDQSGAGVRAVDFDFAAIDRSVQMVEAFDQQWLAFFNKRKIRALVLVYEDLVANYQRTLRGVCEFAGAAGNPLSIEKISLEKQADALSQEWEREYRRLKGGTAAAKDADQVPVRPRRAQVTSGRRLVEAPLPARAPAAPAAPAAPGSNHDAAQAAVLQDLRPDQLIAYDLNPHMGVRIVTGSPRRAWMDASANRFAYRCLPLVIANQYGWLVLCPYRIKAVWSGEPTIEAVSIEHSANNRVRFASSHFGGGILTFSMNHIFRTPPGVNLHVRGPANLPKDGIYPLEGIVETDWSEATFTMNWKMTRPNQPVTFEKDEPFAMLTPVARGVLERFRPEIRGISDDPALESGYQQWAASRFDFNRQLKVKDSPAQRKGWQRHYIRGEAVSQRRAREHQTNVPLSNFVDKRKPD
jgi:LPS sulfotransferase NodH